MEINTRREETIQIFAVLLGVACILGAFLGGVGWIASNDKGKQPCTEQAK